MYYPVKYEDSAEFFGQIIDIFEDFLEEKGIKIENEEKDDCGDDEDLAIIFGSDYDYIRDRIARMMLQWGIAEGY